MPEPGKPLILIVDDSAEVRQALSTFLRSNGCETEQASNGQEALQMVRVRRPDLVICDVVMPAMMGWEVCQRLKAFCAPQPLPVIMLTGKTTELDEMRSFEATADEHMNKPPNMPNLLKTIQRLLAARAKS